MPHHVAFGNRVERRQRHHARIEPRLRQERLASIPDRFSSAPARPPCESLRDTSSRNALARLHEIPQRRLRVWPPASARALRSPSRAGSRRPAAAGLPSASRSMRRGRRRIAAHPDFIERQRHGRHVEQLERIRQQAPALRRPADRKLAHHRVVKAPPAVPQPHRQQFFHRRQDRGGSAARPPPRLLPARSDLKISLKCRAHAPPTAFASCTIFSRSVRRPERASRTARCSPAPSGMRLSTATSPSGIASAVSASSMNSGSRFSTPMRGRRLCAQLGRSSSRSASESSDCCIAR